MTLVKTALAVVLTACRGLVNTDQLTCQQFPQKFFKNGHINMSILARRIRGLKHLIIWFFVVCNLSRNGARSWQFIA